MTSRKKLHTHGKNVYFFLAALVYSALTGCITKEGQKIEAYSFPLRIHAGANLNQGTHGKPLAQVIKIYHLRSPTRFEQTPFDSFLAPETEEKALGTDLLDSREILLIPGQHYEAQETLSVDTQYIGIVAFFRQPAAQRWRLVYSTQNSELTGITLGIHACAMTSTQGALVNKLSGAPESLLSVRCDEPD